jgi:F0F1-type ATP synthase delta subunit
MKHPKATIRYAKAYYKLSVEKNILEEAYKDMSSIIKICKSNKDFVLLLKTPLKHKHVYDAAQLKDYCENNLKYITDAAQRNARGENVG